MMAKFNVGDKVRVLDVDAIDFGDRHYYNGMETEVVEIFMGFPKLRDKHGDTGISVRDNEYHAIERITESAPQYKTEKRKANVGERILITGSNATQGKYATGAIGTVKSVCPVYSELVYVKEWSQPVEDFEYEVIVETPPTPPKPKKTKVPRMSARITALESQVAAQSEKLALLQAKVEALESAGKYPLTERFERESTSMDGILADIERKAKPTLEALLATYPTANQRRADVIKRAQAFVAEYEGIIESDEIIRIEFVVNPDKRTVVAIVHGLLSKKVKRRAVAKCDPDDVFNESIGKAIALARALGVDVPTEFVKAVQPTELISGMRFEVISDTGKSGKYTASSVIGIKVRTTCGCEGYTDAEKRYGGMCTNPKITDDTAAVYE